MSTQRFAIAAAVLLFSAAAFVPSIAGAQPSGAGPDWKDDAPGRVHRIDVAALPAPFATESARDFPRIVAKPDGATLYLPPGFKIDVFSRDADGPARDAHRPER